MSRQASASNGLFRRPSKQIIDYAKLANKGKTLKFPIYAKHHAALPPPTSAWIPSTADRSWVVAALCFALPPTLKLDIRKCIQLSVVHGMMQVSRELCQDTPAKDLLKELEEGESLESEIIPEVDKIAMLLLTARRTEEEHSRPIVQSLSHLQGWAKDILLELNISRDSAATKDSDESEEWSVNKALSERLNLQPPVDRHQNLAVFARIVAHLPRVRRQGWLNHGISNPESVADHSWSMAVFSFLFSEDKGVKIKDAVSQCVVHDIAESLVGDITHKDKIPRTEKYERERRTVAFLQSLIPQDSPLESSWDDFETGKTFTGVVAKQLDQLDLGFQALIYELKLGKRLDEFFKSAERAHLCSELIEEIVNTREIGGSGALDPDALESLNNYYGLQIQ